MDISTPITDEIINNLTIGEIMHISGYIYCGRDAVLPKIIALSEKERQALNIRLEGSAIFHTAVSNAGVGPTSSNKLEIEDSFEPLCAARVKLFLGKGILKRETINLLGKYNAIFAIIPPVTALLNSKTIEKTLLAFPEEGMEAFYRIKVNAYPAIIAAAHGETIYE